MKERREKNEGIKERENKEGSEREKEVGKEGGIA